MLQKNVKVLRFILADSGHKLELETKMYAKDKGGETQKLVDIRECNKSGGGAFKSLQGQMLFYSIYEDRWSFILSTRTGVILFCLQVLL